MRTLYKILIVVVGAFIAYNIAVIAWLLSTPQGVKRLILARKYAPWLVYLIPQFLMTA